MVKIISLERISLDFLIFYKETSSIPIHAVFMLFDLGRIEISIEPYKIATLMDIASYMSIKSTAHVLEVIRPKFKILTDQRYEYIAQKCGLNNEERKALREIQKLIVKEHLEFMGYVLKYLAIVRNSVDPETAKVMVMNIYCQNSELYEMVFGPKVPESIKLKKEQILGLISLKKSEPKPEPKQEQPIQKGEPMFLENLNKDPKIIIFNKIHLHMRAQFRFQLNIFRMKTNQIENSFVLDGFTLDVLKPVGTLKGKIMISINKLFLNYNKSLYQSNVKAKPTIFDNLQNKKLDKSVAEANVENIFELQTTTIEFEANLQQNQKFNNIYLLYGNIKIGLIKLNYMPEVLRKSLINFIVLSKLHSKSFNEEAIERKRKRNLKIVQNTDKRAAIVNISTIPS